MELPAAGQLVIIMAALKAAFYSDFLDVRIFCSNEKLIDSEDELLIGGYPTAI